MNKLYKHAWFGTHGKEINDQGAQCVNRNLCFRLSSRVSDFYAPHQALSFSGSFTEWQGRACVVKKRLYVYVCVCVIEISFERKKHGEENKYKNVNKTNNKGDQELTVDKFFSDLSTPRILLFNMMY